MTCSIEGCQTKASKSKLCHRHLMEARRASGDLCKFPDCPQPRHKNGYCAAHELAARQGRELVPVRRWWSGTLSYSAAHARVRRLYGPADTYPCAGGCGWPAAQWAYDHKDPDAIRGMVKGRKGGMRTWSADPAHYLPLCRTCHLALDRSPLSRGSSL